MKEIKTKDVIKTKSFRLATYQKGNHNLEKLAIILSGKLDSKDYPQCIAT